MTRTRFDSDTVSGQALRDANRPSEAARTTVDADHGRIEIRTGALRTQISWAQDQHAWPGVAVIGKIVRTRETQDKTADTSYYLLSTPLSAPRFTEVTRPQWPIENGLHWVLLVTMIGDCKPDCTEQGREDIGLLPAGLNPAQPEGS